MVIKNFTFKPDDPEFANVRPGSPHPFFSMISLGSSSSDANCSKCKPSLTSIHDSPFPSACFLDKCVRTEAEAGVKTEAEAPIEGILADVVAFWKRMRKARSRKQHVLSSEKMFGDEDQVGHILERFSLSELQGATENFSPENVLGRGAFGKVYKGRLTDGTMVAVKRLEENCSQVGGSQFQQEILMVGLALHRNILRLRGFCMDSDERLLVYPYMANGSLASCLRGRAIEQSSRPPLEWQTRKQIALGAARGLGYLHEHCTFKIIHRDIKAANILLDEEFEAVICDFGTAMLMDYKDTHATSAVCGTVCHIAPEYISEGKVSVKTDVFAYGIMLLELITGRRATDLAQQALDDNVMLLDWVKRLLREGKWRLIIDPAMRGNFVKEEAEQMIHVAVLCTQVTATERPTMADVVKILEGTGLREKWDWMIKKMLHGPMPVDLKESHVSCSLEDAHFNHIRRFSLRDLQVATGNFSPKNTLGRGRFGTVYKGCLADRSLVAVKRLNSAHSLAGALQFSMELLVADLACHRNILKLRGLCSSSTEQLLVYQYMINGTVASRLRGTDSRHPRSPLVWATRKSIALGVAQGLAYLNEQCRLRIVHCNIKAANILLDKDFEPVICDFNLAKPIDPGEANVDATVTVCGTFAHIAPEYLSTGVVSEKADVFSYGVMLLEVITGRSTNDLDRLADSESVMFLDWVKRHLQERKLEAFIDSDIQEILVYSEVEKLVKVALLCTQVDAAKRPKMSEVVWLLEGEGLEARWEEWQKNDILQRQMPVYLEASHVSCQEVCFGYLLKRFSMQELQIATDNFSHENILGRGGFGKVYKGRLANGKLVTVKRLREERTQGGEMQFQMEIEMISLAVHRNLLKLQGFCMTPTERLLVYPYMANGSVASRLRGSATERRDRQPTLEWSTRKHIALGAANGLAYLHDNCNLKIIHRDVKAANVLLDDDFEPVVGDFGLAKMMNYRDTHVSTAVRGTIGHIAPEYLSTGVASDKSDVFGYGIMLLELITGQRAFDLARLANDEDVNLLDWVKAILKEWRLEVLLDPDIVGNYDEEDVENLIRVALLCTQGNASKRPKMCKVVGMLEGEGLEQKWEEWQEEEMLQAAAHPERRNHYLLFPDSSSRILDDQLSGPR